MTQGAREPVLRALGGLATGAAAGATVITGGLLVLRTVQRRGVTETQDAGFLVLTVSVLGGLTVAAVSGWLLSRGIEDLWRRAVTATLAVFGSVLLALLAVPADGLGGRGGLAVYAILLLGGALYAGVHAHRAM